MHIFKSRLTAIVHRHVAQDAGKIKRFFNVGESVMADKNRRNRRKVEKSFHDLGVVVSMNDIRNSAKAV